MQRQQPEKKPGAKIVRFAYYSFQITFELRPVRNVAPAANYWAQPHFTVTHYRYD